MPGHFSAVFAAAMIAFSRCFSGPAIAGASPSASITSPASRSICACDPRTVTVKPAVSVLPAASVALQLTGVEPIERVLPDAGLHSGAIAPSTSSCADAL
jgi:hypothetical protein